MRIISGELGGRRFNPPSKMPQTRPTTDIAKEGLFNILQNNLDFSSLKTLDLFGGTGNISYELASRGVPDLTIVEKDTAMYEFIKKTAVSLGLDQLKIIKMDVFKFIAACTEPLISSSRVRPMHSPILTTCQNCYLISNCSIKADGLYWSILPGMIIRHFHSIKPNGTTAPLFFLCL